MIYTIMKVFTELINPHKVIMELIGHQTIKGGDDSHFATDVHGMNV